MIDEAVLAQLLGELADEIAVPDDGADRVVHELSASGRATRPRVPRRSQWVMAAAAAIVVVGLGVVVNNAMQSSTAKVSSAPTASAPNRTQLAAPAAPRRRAAAKSVAANGALRVSPSVLGQDGNQGAGIQGGVGPQGPAGDEGVQGVAGVTGDIGLVGPQGPSGAQGPTGTSAAYAAPSTNTAAGGSAAATFGAVDGAKIIKTGSLDLQVPKGTLQSQVLRMTHIAVGVGGYVTHSQSNLDPSSATAQMTIRVPVNAFENAISQIESAPGIKVLNDSENGTDVSAQYVNVQAKIQADSGERNSLLVLLSHASNLDDILTLRDKITEVQGVIDQYQGQLNVLSDQSTYSSISVLASEKPPKPHKAAVAHHVVPPTGLSKSWQDARKGFANVVEWFLARSGGALILFIISMLLALALRYLYPVMRRALL